MDGLSAAASIITITHLTGKLLHYLNGVKSAPAERKLSAKEASNFYSLLINLRFDLEDSSPDDPWFRLVQKLEAGPLLQLQQTLEALLDKIEPKSARKKAVDTITWKFTKDEISSLLAQLGRAVNLIQIALTKDHLKLSRAILKTTTELSQGVSDIKNDSLSVLQSASEIKLNTDQMLSSADNNRNSKHRKTVLQWLSREKMGTYQSDILSRREEGTAEWFISTTEFQDWLCQPKKTMFCPGIPGAGKTVISAVTIELLNTKFLEQNIGTAYFYFNYKVKQDMSTAEVLGVILSQLLTKLEQWPDSVESMYRNASEQSAESRPKLGDLRGALVDICKCFTKVYIVLDALDECTDSSYNRNELVKGLLKLQEEANVNIMATSRFNPDIEHDFQNAIKVEIRATLSDVTKYLRRQMPRLPKVVQRNSDIQQEIEKKIAQGAQGMFLLAPLYIDSLLDKRTKTQIQNALIALSSGGDALQSAYVDAMQRIHGQLEGDKIVARNAISWIVLAQRPLTAQELCVALSLSKDTKGFDRDNLLDIEDVLATCAGLLAVDKKSNVVRLVHYTAQEFFEKNLKRWLPSAQANISLICLNHLDFKVYNDFRGRTHREDDENSGHKELMLYIHQHWHNHLRPVQKDVFVLADAKCQTINFEKSKFHDTASKGLEVFLECLLDAEASNAENALNVRDKSGKTPLACAAQAGQTAVVHMLLQRPGIDVVPEDNMKTTPLHDAALFGHVGVVKRLLQSLRPRIHYPLFGYTMPIIMAVSQAHEAVANLLIGTDQFVPHAMNWRGKTALGHAVENGMENTARLLIEKGTPVSLCGENNESPLYTAARRGYASIAALLIDSGADLDKGDAGFRPPYSPLWAAIFYRKIEVAKMLIEAGANVNGGYGENGGPLEQAIEDKEEEVARLIIEKGSALEGRSKDGKTPLALAAELGLLPTVQTLLEFGADVDSTDNIGWTPLFHAIERGSISVARCLITFGASVDYKDLLGRTPFSHAAAQGHSECMEILLAAGAVTNPRDSSSKTLVAYQRSGCPIHLSEEEGCLDEVSLTCP